MTIETKYDIGQTVYLITDPQKMERMIVNITVNPSKICRYCLMQANNESWHYEFEIMPADKEKTKAGFKNNNHEKAKETEKAEV